jgi:HD-GYP domain-containing protein (c-di-GMP phosphodiesterase class II)
MCEEHFQAFADLVFILDGNGSILDYKSGDPSLLATSLDSLLNKRVQDFLPAEKAGGLQHGLHTFSREEMATPLEFSLSLSGRERWFDARLISNSPSQFILSARDITKHKETEIRMQAQLQRLSALRSIDLAIASGLDLNLLLSMLLDHVTTLLHVDATAILLLGNETNILKFAAGSGFRTNILQHTHLKLGEGCGGLVALERRMIHIPDLTKNRVEFDKSPLFSSENFIAYYGVPLVAKGRTLGVLEIFHRAHLDPDSEWMDFLNIISGQAAIAIDSAMMFKDLQKSNIELSLAYNATIDGWSRTLDLRDKETEGHTRRVTDITLRLAASMGIDDSELIHIRRGAILHDIGKMAIPDHILFKPGPLTNEEWETMRQHPRYAMELLSPINYLASAMAIPHWHHEKWDGSGYPDRLDGEDIPFSARLFALADVYDALTSDRPYRNAWSKQDAVQYIEIQSGKHFDPRLVPEFLNLVNHNGL